MAAPSSSPAIISSPTTGTLDVSAGETVTFKPANGLHNREVIHIVATGLTPGGQYAAIECKAAGAYCDTAGFRLATSDASGTVRIDYTAVKGSFAAEQITCGTAESCGIAVFPIAGSMDQLVTINLDFA
jgi:hypothetical protein